MNTLTVKNDRQASIERKAAAKTQFHRLAMEQTEGETECQGESDPLRKEGAAGHSGQSESTNVDKKQARGDVEQVLHDGDEQRCARILHAEQPTIEHIETEHGRCAPNEHPKVGGGVCDDGRRCRHERKPHVQKGV